MKNYIRHLYGNDTQFNYGVFKNGNGKYILAYYRKHLRNISGMAEFDSAIDFLERNASEENQIAKNKNSSYGE
ncbi:hypothetical protein HpBT060_15140 [Helicobacter pylori]